MEATGGILNKGITASVYSPAGRFGDSKDFGNGIFRIKGSDGKSIAAAFGPDMKYRRTEEGYLLIERRVELVP